MARRQKKRPLRPRKPTRVKRRTGKRARRAQRSELVGLAVCALGLFLASLLYLGWSGGFAGAAIVEGLDRAIGAVAYLLPAALLVAGSLLVARSELLDMRPFRTGALVVVLGVFLVLGASAGLVGEGLDDAVARVVGGTGRILLGATATLVGALLLTGASIGAFVRRSGHVVRRATVAARRSLERPEPPRVPRQPLVADSHKVAPAEPPVDAVAAYPDVVGERAPQPVALRVELEPDPPDDVSAEDALPGAKRVADYRLPDRTLLRRSPPAAAGGREAGAQVADALIAALGYFGIDASVIGQISGPRVTRYELQLAPGTKMSKVAALKDDLSYALATTEIRILAPIPGKQAVGVEVPNLAPNLVTLGDIYDDLPQTASPLAVWLGKDISGNAVWTDLARMPHILIAGTTGSGKSGCINTLLTSILLRSTPDEVRLILIDPKRIELSYYESIPHLLTPVVSSPKEASSVLANVVAEMDRRYERLATVRARNLPEANRALRKRGDDPLPYLLVVIDELADLMMISPQAVEDAVIRLAQKSRAVGIHLVLATQRPSVDVITGMIKANVPSRIAFAVSSQTDSRVVLDQAGAESLLGQGDMLFKPLGTSRLQRVQGAYVTEEEIALIVEQCRVQREQELDESLLQAPEEPVDAEAGDEDFDPDEDPLLDRAIEIVVQTQTASVSLLQRRLRVGYTRAGRLIDMLERRGIISGYEGSKPRRVLVEEQELDRVLERVS
ncbi:MAG: DNA translocase FtsK [Thermoleophilia bacterium]|nr:DNA translocase FtsK [Thermoleophilia bacterium]